MTMEEHDAWLKETGQWETLQEAGRKRERELAEIARLRALAEAPLVAELRGAGLDVDSVWDLVNAREPYPKAVPILFKYLSLPCEDEVIRDGIARALGTPDAKYGWDVLVSEYKKIADRWSIPKGGLAVALMLLAGDDEFDEILELARDKRHGLSRISFLDVIKKSKRPEAPKILEELAGDDYLVLAISSMKAYWKKHNPALLERWKSPEEKKRLVLIDKQLTAERRASYEKNS